MKIKPRLGMSVDKMTVFDGMINAPGIVGSKRKTKMKKMHGEGIARLQCVLSEDAGSDQLRLSREIQKHIKANDAKSALKALVWALDNSEPEQEKLIGILSKLIVG